MKTERLLSVEGRKPLFMYSRSLVGQMERLRASLHCYVKPQTVSLTSQHLLRVAKIIPKSFWFGPLSSLWDFAACRIAGLWGIPWWGRVITVLCKGKKTV